MYITYGRRGRRATPGRSARPRRRPPPPPRPRPDMSRPQERGAAAPSSPARLGAETRRLGDGPASKRILRVAPEPRGRGGRRRRRRQQVPRAASASAGGAGRLGARLPRRRPAARLALRACDRALYGGGARCPGRAAQVGAGGNAQRVAAVPAPAVGARRLLPLPLRARALLFRAQRLLLRLQG